MNPDRPYEHLILGRRATEWDARGARETEFAWERAAREQFQRAQSAQKAVNDLGTGDPRDAEIARLKQRCEVLQQQKEGWIRDLQTSTGQAQEASAKAGRFRQALEIIAAMTTPSSSEMRRIAQDALRSG